MVFIAVSLAANSPLLGRYEYYLDDYPQFNMTVAEWLDIRGVWRIAGTLIPAWLVSLNWYGAAAIAVHAIGGFLFFLIARVSLGSVSYALFLTALLLAPPWGYQALIWASAFSFACASCLLWAILYALLVFPVTVKWFHACVFAAVLICASFLCLLFNEAVFFALCLSGIIVWVKPRQPGTQQICRLVSLAPFVGALLWGALYEVSKPLAPVKEVTNINIASAFSPLFYQYRNFEVFEVWTNGLMWNRAFSTVALPDIGLTLVALSTVPFLIHMILRSREPASQQKASSLKLRAGALFIWMLAVSVGAAAIYALGGGYSLDSRKRYLIVSLVIMLIASVAWLLISYASRCRLLPSRLTFFASIATTVMCTIGSVTSLLMVSLWKHEIQRINLLADAIVENGVSRNLRLEFNPEMIDLWPASASSWGLDSTLALNRALNARGHQSISVVSDAAHRMFWNHEERRWIWIVNDQ
jgi:hypothetical protein